MQPGEAGQCALAQEAFTAAIMTRTLRISSRAPRIDIAEHNKQEKEK
jgi:hypothetical protein